MGVLVCLLGFPPLAEGQNEAAVELRKELDALRGDYERRIDQLELRIRELEGQPAPAKPKPRRPAPAVAKPVEPAPVVDANRARRAIDNRFREDTEIRDLARRQDEDNLLAERIENIVEGYIDITGYFRAGYGRSDEGGPQQAFGIPGVAKYRLGNEAENYGELAFAKTFYPAGAFGGGAGGAESGPVARVNYRLSFFNPYADYGSAAGTDYSTPEIWASLANVVPGQPEAKIWAGNRFYRRHDIHINDYYFWDMSGGGAGVEDLELGNGKLAVAWIGDGAESAIYSSLGRPDPLNVAGFSKANFDFRYYDWPLLGGTGEVGLIYASANSGADSKGRQAEDSDGFALSVVRTDEEFLDKNSLHKTSLQIGNGPAKTFNSGFETFDDGTGSYISPDSNESWRFRATDQIVIKPTEDFSIGSALVYQYTDTGDGRPSHEWVSAGLRPIWHITDVFSLAFEGGFDWVSGTPGGSGGSLGKLTLAPQVALGDEFLSRPVLRAFVTYAMWGNGLQGEVGGPDYSLRDSGWTWGVQMESWW